MKPDFYIIVVFLIALEMMTIPFLVVGIRGLKTQRPFLISLRWPVAMMFVVVIASLLLLFLFVLFMISKISQPIPLTILSSLLLSACSLLLSGCILLIVWDAMKGFMAFGVTYTPFREGLLVTLEKLRLPYEEPLTLRRLRPALSKRVIRLTSVEADLQVSMAMGAAYLNVKQNQHYPLLREIANAMNEYFRASPVRMNIIPFALYLTPAVFLVILAIGVLLFPSIF